MELINLQTDLGGEADLSRNQPGRTAQLRDELHAWQKQVGARFPIPNLGYDPAKPSGRAAERPAAGVKPKFPNKP